MALIKSNDKSHYPVYLEFDGYCVLCNRAVDLLFRLDRKQKIKVKVLEPTSENSTLILHKKGKVFKRSKAVFEILKEIGGIWKVFLIFSIFPQNWTDGLYNLIARNRYLIWGKRMTCRMPNEKDKNRFIT